MSSSKGLERAVSIVLIIAAVGVMVEGVFILPGNGVLSGKGYTHYETGIVISITVFSAFLFLLSQLVAYSRIVTVVFLGLYMAIIIMAYAGGWQAELKTSFLALASGARFE